MISLHDLFLSCKNRFMQNGFSDGQASFEAETIVRFCAGCENWKLFLPDFYADGAVAGAVKEYTEQRLTGIPLQYVLGEWDFCGNTFFVGSGVLIPRPETEELTDTAISMIRKKNLKTVYDLCSGSGCIGLSIAKAVPDCTVCMIEKYPVPISYIKRNTEHLGITNAKVVCDDVLCPETKASLPCADLIISNPPYIPKKEIPCLQTEVQYEPKEALDGGEDGLLFYHSILRNWIDKLNSPGFVFLECGEGQAQTIAEAARSAGFAEMRIFSDMYGTERFLLLKK